MKRPKTRPTTKLIGLRLPVEWIDAVKQHCADAGYPGAHPTVIRRAMEIGFKTLGVKIPR